MRPACSLVRSCLTDSLWHEQRSQSTSFRGLGILWMCTSPCGSCSLSSTAVHAVLSSECNCFIQAIVRGRGTCAGCSGLVGMEEPGGKPAPGSSEPFERAFRVLPEIDRLHSLEVRTHLSRSEHLIRIGLSNRVPCQHSRLCASLAQRSKPGFSTDVDKG